MPPSCASTRGRYSRIVGVTGAQASGGGASERGGGVRSSGDGGICGGATTRSGGGENGTQGSRGGLLKGQGRAVAWGRGTEARADTAAAAGVLGRDSARGRWRWRAGLGLGLAGAGPAQFSGGKVFF